MAGAADLAAAAGAAFGAAAFGAAAFGAALGADFDDVCAKGSLAIAATPRSATDIVIADRRSELNGSSMSRILIDQSPRGGWVTPRQSDGSNGIMAKNRPRCQCGLNRSRTSQISRVRTASHRAQAPH